MQKSPTSLNIPRVKFLYVVLQYAESWKDVNGSNWLEKVEAKRIILGYHFYWMYSCMYIGV